MKLSLLLLACVSLLASSSLETASPQSTGPASGSPASVGTRGTMSGGRRLSVQVIAGNTSVGFSPVAGAIVTLSGSSTNCAGRLSAFTDAQGNARFDNVRGPFTVTAQIDFMDMGPPAETVRVAQTLVDVSPGASRITVPFLIDDEVESKGGLDAFLSGTVTGIPALLPGEILQIEYSTRDGDPDFNLVTPVVVDEADPTMGTYSIPVPSGVTLDFALVRKSCGLGSCPPTEATLRVGLGPYAGNSSQNFDYSQGLSVPLVSTLVTYSNLLGSVQIQEAYLCLRGAGGIDVEIRLFADVPGTLPSSLALPAPTDAGLLGLASSIHVEQYEAGGEIGGECVELLESSDFHFDMLGWPALSVPSVVPTASAGSLSVSYVEGPGAQANGNGVNWTELESKDPGLPGIDSAVWSLAQRPGSTSLTLPPTALPMFGPGAQYGYSFETVRFDVDVDFDAFFGGNFENNLACLEDAEVECGVLTYAPFQTPFDVLLAPVSILRVRTASHSGVNSPRTASEASTLETLALYIDRLNEAYASTGVLFIADETSLSRARNEINVSGSVVDGNGVFEQFPCGPACAPSDCDEFGRMVAALSPFVAAQDRLTFVPVGNMQQSPMGLMARDPLAVTVLAGCTVLPGDFDFCARPTGCIPTGCGNFQNSGFLSFLQDDGVGPEIDSDGFVVAHEAGHQFGLCHCDWVLGPTNLMVSKCQADANNVFCPANSLCDPPICDLKDLNPTQVGRVLDVVSSF